MSSDEKLVLRSLLADLRAIRLRVDRQIGAVQRALRATRMRAPAKAGGERKTNVSKSVRKKGPGRPVGYAKERTALARRLARK